MTRNAVITLAIGYEPFWVWTHPIMQRYARRINADFIVIDQLQRSVILTQGYKLEKFQLRNYLEKYDRILFLDSDIAIHPQCPDLFSQVREEELGVVCECLPYFNREAIFQEACQFYGVSYPGSAQTWFNTGMMILSHCHRQLFTEPKKVRAFNVRYPDGSLAPKHFTWLDMPLLNCLRVAYNIPLRDLGYSFNYLYNVLAKNPPSQPEDAWIFHGAGKDKSSLERIIKQWYPEFQTQQARKNLPLV